MDILENGLDSIGKSINLLKKIHNTRNNEYYEFLLKDIIINLHHSTETLFKYLIKQKDEYLIYSDLEDIFKINVENKFKSTNKIKQMQTIQFMDAIHRVIILYDIDLKQEEYNRFKFLNDIRNSLTHYELEFKGDITEHTIALLLPTLFNIYSKYICIFDDFANKNNFYVDIKDTIKIIEIWNLKRIFQLNKKVDKAIAYINALENDSKQKSKIIKTNESNIEYIDCPICKYKKFKANGNLILANDNIDFTGICMYCGISIEKQDVQFINLNFSSYDNFLTWRRRFAIDIFSKILNSDIALNEEYKGTR